MESGPAINARWKVNVKLEFEAFLSFVRLSFMLCTYNYQDKPWYVWPCARSLKQWAVQKNQPFTKIQDTYVASEQIWRCGKRSKVHTDGMFAVQQGVVFSYHHVPHRAPGRRARFATIVAR